MKIIIYLCNGGTLSIENGELKAVFTPEEQAKNRWSTWGQKLHLNNIRRGHGKADQGKDVIIEKSKKYAEYNRNVKLPELIKE